jgi:hypothetical protein
MHRREVDLSQIDRQQPTPLDHIGHIRAQVWEHDVRARDAEHRIQLFDGTRRGPNCSTERDEAPTVRRNVTRPQLLDEVRVLGLFDPNLREM